MAAHSATRASSHTDTDTKRSLGSYYTIGNPFTSPAFDAWRTEIPDEARCVEPFAGSGNIPILAAQVGYTPSWKLFDVDASIRGVTHRDTLKNFPRGFDVVLTNPPYLSYHFAKRKGLPVTKEDFHGHSSLYLVAIEHALREAKWAGFLIPESFITAQVFTERLHHVVSLRGDLFADTEVPVCLALFGPEKTSDFQVWRDATLLGNYSDLAQALTPTPCARNLHFNRTDGQIGLMGIDNTRSASISFTAPSEIPVEKVKHSARLVSRIFIDGKKVNTEALRELANTELNAWRTRTSDVLLTAFKGSRDDGLYRRRLDYGSARALLSHAFCELQEHEHKAPELALL
jgi:hypothetical protein